MDIIENCSGYYCPKAISERRLPKKECKTEHISIHGNSLQQLLSKTTYIFTGTNVPKILALQEQEPQLRETTQNYDYTLAEVVWAIRHEMAEQLVRRIEKSAFIVPRYG
jgi:glycerol-3-phosphate dehydrogenase